MTKNERINAANTEEVFFIIFMVIISILSLGGAFLVWWFLKMAVQYGVRNANKRSE